MARIRPTQFSFGTGEISPRLVGRQDKERYFNALEEMENYQITHHGAAERRPGWHYVATVKDSMAKTLVRSFQFSTVQSYVIEVGPFYMRFYRDGGQILTGLSPVEIATPYAEADLESLRFVQSADTLYIFHANYAPRKLVRSSHTSWTLSQIVFSAPATEEYSTALAANLTLSAVSGDGVTVTASAGVFLAADEGRVIRGTAGGRGVIVNFTSSTVVTIDVLDAFPSTSISSGQWTLEGSPNADLTPQKAGPLQRIINLTLSADGWRASDVGKYVHVNGGIVKTTAMTSATVMKGIIQRILDKKDLAESGSWTIEAEAWNATNGFPKTATFHEGRLYAASTAKKPQTIWASAVDSYENFGRGSKEDEGMEFTVASPLVDAIEWLIPTNFLFVGTFGGVHRATGSQDKHITPADISVKNYSADGSASRVPVRVGSSILYISRAKNRVLELAYNLDEDAFISQDLSLLSDHLGESVTFEEMTYAQNPWSTIYVRRSDGVVCGLAYNRKQNQIGWFRVVTSGGGVVESLATIPHWTKPYDAVFGVVKITVGGNQKKYIAYLDRELNTDLALTRVPTGVKVATVSGLSHLEGLTVDVVGDGARQPQAVVYAGSIDLTYPADAVEVGLHYDSRLKTLPLATAQGELTGIKKRITSVIVRFYRTISAVVNNTIVPFRTTNDLMDSGIPAFSGEQNVTLLQVDSAGQITIEQRDPLPQTILYLNERTEANTL